MVRYECCGISAFTNLLTILTSLFHSLAGFLEREVRKDNLPMMSFGDNPEAPQPREMIDLEATFEKLENELNEVVFLC